MRLARSANCIVMRHITANPWPQTMARAPCCVIWSLKSKLGFCTLQLVLCRAGAYRDAAE